jgi:hypothetical protein
MNNLKKKEKKIPNTEKGLVEWLKWLSACLARMKPRVQNPVLSKKKKSV